MKKVLALILALVMVLSMAACGGEKAPEQNKPESGEKTAADVKIVLLLPGEINDQGWNASNYAGVVA